MVTCSGSEEAETEWFAIKPKAASPMAATSKCAGAKRRMGSLKRINGQTAEQLGIEVGGFLRHHLAGEGDVAHLRGANRIHEKSKIGRFGIAQTCDRFGRIAV